MGIRGHPRSPEVTKVRRFRHILIFFVKKILFQKSLSLIKLFIRVQCSIFPKKFLIFENFRKILLRKFALEFFPDISGKNAYENIKGLAQSFLKSYFLYLNKVELNFYLRKTGFSKTKVRFPIKILDFSKGSKNEKYAFYLKHL